VKYLPQGYPLWCAELSDGSDVYVGLVVGWLQPDVGTYSSYDLVPIITRRGAGPHRGVDAITTVLADDAAGDYVELFFATSEQGAVDAALASVEARAAK
jgi:hypothetical protein